MHCCRIVNGIKNKKQLWSNVECFAFGPRIKTARRFTVKNS